jgi:hypothetical protein
MLKCCSLIRHFKPRFKLNSKMFKNRLDRYQILMPESGISLCQPRSVGVHVRGTLRINRKPAA